MISHPVVGWRSPWIHEGEERNNGVLKEIGKVKEEREGEGGDLYSLSSMIDARSIVEGKGRCEGAERMREEEARAPTITYRREEEQRGGSLYCVKEVKSRWKEREVGRDRRGYVWQDLTVRQGRWQGEGGEQRRAVTPWERPVRRRQVDVLATQVRKRHRMSVIFQNRNKGVDGKASFEEMMVLDIHF